MFINVNVTVCGYGVNLELEVEDSELEGMNEEEKDEYLQQQAYEYVKENLEVSCEVVEEQKSINDLSSKINYALEHIEAMQAKAERAYKKLQTDYTWEQIAAKYDLVYQELLSKEQKIILHLQFKQ